MLKISSFGTNMRMLRRTVLDASEGKLTSPEATVIASALELESQAILHPETREDVHRRAQLIDKSPLKLGEVARKFLGERRI